MTVLRTTGGKFLRTGGHLYAPVTGSPPPLSILSTNLSSNTMVANSAPGTVVGSLTFVMSDGSTPTGTWLMTNSAGGDFQLGGMNHDQVQALAANVPAGNYQISGTLTVSGASNSPLTWSATIQVTGGNPSITSAMLNGTTMPQNSPTGTVIGNLVFTMSDNSSPTAQWTMTTTSNGQFALSGSSGTQVTANASNITNGSYNVGGFLTVTNATNSPYAWSATITVTGGQTSNTGVTFTQGTLQPNQPAGHVAGQLILVTAANNKPACTSSFTSNPNNYFSIVNVAPNINYIQYNSASLAPGQYTVAGTTVAPSEAIQNYTWSIQINIGQAIPTIVNTNATQWIQRGNPMPAFAVSGMSGTNYAQLYTGASPEGGRVAFSGSNLPTLVPAANGIYSVRVFNASGGGTLLAESDLIQVWASASGPASAAITITGIPNVIQQGVPFQLSGHASTASEYILVGLKEASYNNNVGYRPVPVDGNGNWQWTFVTLFGLGSSMEVFAIDPSQNPVWQLPFVGQNTFAYSTLPSVTAGNNSSGPAIEIYYPGDKYGYNTQNTITDQTPYGNDMGVTIGYDPSLIAAGGTGSATCTLINGAGVLAPGSDFHLTTNGGTPPGIYNMTWTISYSGTSQTSVGTYTYYVPHVASPTNASIAWYQQPTNHTPRRTCIGSIQSYSQDAGWFVYLNDPTGSFYIFDYQIFTVKPLVAGSYPVQFVIQNDSVTVTTINHTIVVTNATLLAPSHISYTIPTGIANTSALGTSLGTPTVTGMGSNVQWCIIQDRGYRIKQDPSTGAMSIQAFLSGTMGGETIQIAAFDGTNYCLSNSITIPVSAFGGTVYNVGPGQTYTTVMSAMLAFQSACQTNFIAGANAVFNVHYQSGGYYNDMGITSNGNAFYPPGPYKMVGIPDPTTGRRPWFWYPIQQQFGGKAPFIAGGYDHWWEGIEVSRGYSNQHSNAFYYFMEMGEGSWVSSNSVMVKNCVIHDCEDGMGRGGGFPTQNSSGQSRYYAQDTLWAYNTDGGGYCHHNYPLGGHAECTNCTFVGGSNGHQFKSRCDTSILTNCNFICTNDASVGAILDFPDGGDVTITNCKFWLGSNNVNQHIFGYGFNFDNYHIAMGKQVLIDGCTFYTQNYSSMEFTTPSGITSFYSGRGSYLYNSGFADLTVQNSSFVGLQQYVYGEPGCDPLTIINNTVTPNGVTVNYNPTLAAVGLTPTGLSTNFSDARFGPTPGAITPILAATYQDSRFPNNVSTSTGFRPMMLLGAYPQAPEVSHTAGVGTVIDTFYLNGRFSELDAYGIPIDYLYYVAPSVRSTSWSWSLWLVTDAAGVSTLGQFSVDSGGTIRTAASIANLQGLAIILGVDVVDSNGDHWPFYQTIFVV